MSEACQDCRGTGYVPNDPDLEKLRLCLTCGGTGELDEERDFAMERSKLAADREDAEEGRQERLREKKEGNPAGFWELTEVEQSLWMANKRAELDKMLVRVESIFSKDGPPEAWPEDRSKRSQIIGDIAEELVFGNGKEE